MYTIYTEKERERCTHRTGPTRQKSGTPGIYATHIIEQTGARHAENRQSAPRQLRSDRSGAGHLGGPVPVPIHQCALEIVVPVWFGKYQLPRGRIPYLYICIYIYMYTEI